MTRRLGFPHPLALLLGCVALAAALTWVIPAGSYERRDDPVTGRAVVVAGTYRTVEAAPVGPFQALTAVPRGFIDAASIIALVFLSGAGFTVVERTGALRRAVAALTRRLAGRGIVIMGAVALVFTVAGVVIQMAEELVAFAPLLLVLCAALGLPPLMAVAVSLGAASVGAMFSPVDPFMVIIAQKAAGVPVGSGWEFRTVLLAIAVGFWLLTLRQHALAVRSPEPALAAEDTEPLTARQGLVLAIVVLTLLLFAVGAQQWHWDFDKLAAIFLAMGLLAGLAGGLGVEGTARTLIDGARDMTFSALLIGIARAIYVVLDEGRVVDTLVHAIATPLDGLPPAVAALGMMGAHALIHVPVPSTSGHAVLTMPILAPVSDLIGLQRQVAVLAYQLGAGLVDLVTPTSAPLMAMLAACGVPYEEWLRWVVPRCLVLVALSVAALAVAVAIGWS
ncbi:MAG TPA: hypothetical protein VFX50_00720 [Gemmatimonadales bacterium]|nr:hypothetical protein [Gemmatimonadales bacterium]